jgi:hypothetical protein
MIIDTSRLEPAQVLIALYAAASTTTDTLESSASFLLGGPGSSTARDEQVMMKDQVKKLTLEEADANNLVIQHVRWNKSLYSIGPVRMYIISFDVKNNSIEVDDAFAAAVGISPDLIIGNLRPTDPIEQLSATRSISPGLLRSASTTPSSPRPTKGLWKIRTADNLDSTTPAAPDSTRPELPADKSDRRRKSMFSHSSSSSSKDSSPERSAWWGSGKK